MNIQDMVEILLVEDNPNDAELAIRAFGKNNFSNHFIHFSTGEDVLDFLYCRGAYIARNGKDRPKLILLDLKLPHLSGLEVLKVLKNDEDKKTIPVVILTSSKEESDLIKSYQLGANSYLVKPVDFEKFCDVIKEIGLYWLLLNQRPQYS